MHANLLRPRESWLALGVLAVAFLGNQLTSGKVFLLSISLAIFCQDRILKLIDARFLLLLLGTTLYFLNGNLSGRGYQVELNIILFPCLLYLAGKWYGGRCSSESSFLLSQLLIGTLMALVYMVSVLLNIYSNGFVGLARNISIVGAGDGEISATVIAGHLVMLTSFAGVLFTKSNSITFRSRFLIAILLILDFLVVIRLGSRTHLVIMLASLAAGYFVNRQRFNRLSRLIIYALAFAALIVASNIVTDDSVMATYFMDRVADDASSATTAGGRLERWTGSLGLLAVNPLGWGFVTVGYAHNLWLDVARVGGWAALLLMLLFSAFAIYATIKSLQENSSAQLFVTVSVCLTVGFYLLFVVEPILDGFLYPFAAYCSVLGSIIGFRVNKRR